MAKQPEIETLVVGYNEKHKINKNFKAIAEKFDEMLSRDTTTDTPNFMAVDLDVADANITNVNRLEVNSIVVVDENFTGFSDEYVYKLAQLDCDEPGSIITHGDEGEPICLEIGSTDEVLKSDGERPVWEEDIDTDTVGVTVQEDGVTVAENVTNINFIWTSVAFPDIVTTPASDQVDIALDDVKSSTLVAIWEDARPTNDDNINPDGPDGQFMQDANEINRLDLVNDVGISVPTGDNDYYVIVETSNKTTDSVTGPAAGDWTNGVRFYDATGTSTPLTGVQILQPVGEVASQQGSTNGGNLLTTYCGIPAGTRYIDFAHADLFVFPVFATGGIVDNRYRAIVPAAARDSVDSPNGIAYPGGVNPSVTP